MFVALDEGSPVAPSAAVGEIALVVGSGLSLAAAGLATGPSVPLVGIGGALLLFGVGRWLRGRNGH